MIELFKQLNFITKGNNMLFEKIEKAWEDKDAKAHRALFHDDHEFISHVQNKTFKKSEGSEEQTQEMLDNITREKVRCVYENDDILITHTFNTFKSGDRESLMVVSLKKDGLIWRTETGATELK